MKVKIEYVKNVNSTDLKMIQTGLLRCVNSKIIHTRGFLWSGTGEITVITRDFDELMGAIIDINGTVSHIACVNDVKPVSKLLYNRYDELFSYDKKGTL